MLTRIAQPTSHEVRGARSRLSAAGSAIIALALVLLTLTAPACASAQGSATAEAGTGAWPWPLLGEVITPYSNGSDPYAAGQHRGLDIAAPVGSPVLAIVDGRVSFSGRLPDGGETITVRSSDGQWLVSYLHLSSRGVARGASAIAGMTLGAVGTTGRRSADEPHLHLSVRRTDTRAYVDPLTLLGARRLPRAPREARAESAKVLERPAARSAEVHAQSRGDSSPAQRHGALERQVTAARPAGAHAREGHAARRGISRVAPPPLKIAATVADRPSSKAVVPDAVAAEVPGDSKADRRPAPPRSLLFAIAAVCAAALLMRRRQAPAEATAPPPLAEPRAPHDAKVLEFDRSRKSA